MAEIIWLNGKLMPMSEARIGVEDRGFQFADGVYEVIRIYRGKPFLLAEHLQRLKNSTEGIRLPLPIDLEKLEKEIRAFISKVGHAEGMIYLQLTRGQSERSHAYPARSEPTLLFHVRPLPAPIKPGEGEGVKLLSMPDERWKRCWIKSIALLPNVIAKNTAIDAGADEAVFIENDIVTECASSNIFAIVGKRLLTHPVGSKVLPGITRGVLLELAPSVGLEPDERAFREEEARRADELFITSTTREISWVARLNDRYIGQGKCGAGTRNLHEALLDRIKGDCG